MPRTLRAVLAAFALLCLLTACGGGDDTDNPVAPVPAGQLPEPSAPPPPTGETPPTLVITGVAARGAALDGASVEVRGPDGNIIELGDVVTGNDGSYQVVLPLDTPLPVLITITPPQGDPVRTIIPAAEDDGSITANVNPLTELVAGQVIGALESDPATLGSSLAAVAADPEVVRNTGNQVVGNLLGAGASYDSFSNDPDFVAATGDGSTAPSVTDTLLDTLQRTAARADKPLSQFLTESAAKPDPPRLLEKPSFQIQYVGELVKQGNDPAELEQRLTDAGTITPLAEGDDTDVFRQALVAVPRVLAATDANTTSLDGNPTLKRKAADAAVDTLAALVDQRQTRFADSDEELEAALASEAVTNTVSTVVNNVVRPVLESVAARGDGGASVDGALDEVLEDTTDAAGQTLSAFSPSTLETTDVSTLTTRQLQQNVLSVDVATQLDGLADGSVTQEQVVRRTQDVIEVNAQLNDLVTNDETLIEGGSETLNTVVEEPPGAWNVDAWNEFDWS